MFMCLACSEIYDNYFDVCPKACCNAGNDDVVDEIIYVDDVFAPVLAEFNKKGYEIYDSDFGNPNNNAKNYPYIVFSDYICNYFDSDGVAKLFDKLPAPWEFEIKDGHPTISCCIFGSNSMSRFCGLLRAHLVLANFVENLDELHI